MISGVYITDSQGEILIERSYTLAPTREPIKKVIRSQLSSSDSDKSLGGSTAGQDQIVWDVDGSYIFAIRRARILLLALTQKDAFIPEIYEVLHKIEAVLEASLPDFGVDTIKARSTEILIVLLFLIA